MGEYCISTGRAGRRTSIKTTLLPSLLVIVLAAGPLGACSADPSTNPTATGAASSSSAQYGPPPIADLAVAITADQLRLIDTRSGHISTRVGLGAPLTADGTRRVARFVEISPDKTTAVVTASEIPEAHYSLWTVDLVTAEVTRLADDAVWPSYSPDGTRLAYTKARGTREGGDTIVLRDLATASEHPLTRSGVDGLPVVSSTTWGPDNRTLAYNYGYYGHDTYLIDTMSASSLDDARKLEDVSFIDWREPDVAFVYWYCCDEAAPGVVSTYRLGTGEHTPANVPPLFGFIDRNNQDGRLAGVDATATPSVLRYTNARGELTELPECRHLAW